ncbi:hypothetical protein B0H12DRAFT_1241219 [Mycena haematopus]|nr:hypothetical protein B0H12DRAFT_1241219 [Mycena haematopus]
MSYNDTDVSLIDAALGVQNDLQKVKQAVVKVDAVLGTKALAEAALLCQTKYDSVLQASRKSANLLQSRISGFVEDCLPLVDDETAPFEEVKENVRDEANKITREYESKDSAGIDEAFKEVQGAFGKVQSELQTAEDSLTAQLEGPLEAIKSNLMSLDTSEPSLTGRISDVGKKLFGGSIDGDKGGIQKAPETKSKTDPTKKVDPTKKPDPTKPSNNLEFVHAALKKWSAIKEFFDKEKRLEEDVKERQRKLDEVADLQEEINAKLSEIRAAKKEAADTAKSLGRLEGKLGNFKDIWSKIVQDLKKLSIYLKDPKGTATREGLAQRVKQEAGSYKAILLELSNYALKV